MVERQSDVPKGQPPDTAALGSTRRLCPLGYQSCEASLSAVLKDYSLFGFCCIYIYNIDEFHERMFTSDYYYRLKTEQRRITRGWCTP